MHLLQVEGVQQSDSLVNGYLWGARALTTAGAWTQDLLTLLYPAPFYPVSSSSLYLPSFLYLPAVSSLSPNIYPSPCSHSIPIPLPLTIVLHFIEDSKWRTATAAATPTNNSNYTGSHTNSSGTITATSTSSATTSTETTTATSSSCTGEQAKT